MPSGGRGSNRRVGGECETGEGKPGEGQREGGEKGTDARGRLKRSPDAKIAIMSPLRRKVAVMIQPKSPSASPLGQSKVGA